MARVGDPRADLIELFPILRSTQRQASHGVRSTAPRDAGTDEQEEVHDVNNHES